MLDDVIEVDIPGSQHMLLLIGIIRDCILIVCF